jgi:hypothetical protein
MGVMKSARMQLVASALVLAYLTLVPAFLSDPLVTRSYYLRQDWVGASVYIAAMLAAAFGTWRLGTAWSPRAVPDMRLILAMTAALILALWAGTYWIMLDYPLTRDELMAGFDARIFAAGKLAEPVAQEWRDYIRALVPDFYLPMAGNTALVSSYMPGNALMRAGFEALGAPQLLNPLLAGIGLVAMWDVARRLFPDCAPAVWVITAGYLLSAQVLVNAMTSYAMTGHLALNAIWLSLFLRNRAWSHACAMVVGIWAIGLHQVAFHPFAVGAIILTLLLDRRWGLFAAYAVVYAAALAGWMIYPSWVMDSVGASPGAASGGVGVGSFVTERIVPMIAKISPYTLPLMIYNLLRFFVWMPAFCLPLLLWSVRPAKRREVLPAALLASIGVTTAAVVLLMAYQGHGWGYRYWHAIIPHVLLLCGYGFREWLGEDRQLARRAVTLLATVTLLVLPFLLVTSQRFVVPYDKLTRLLDRQTAEFVIVETDPPGSAVDQVRNRADLTNRPLLLGSHALDNDLVRELCRRGTVTLVRKSRFHLVQFGQALVDGTAGYDELERWLAQQPCWRPVV